MENSKMILTTEDCVKVGDKIYFISKDINIIFELNILTKEIVIIDSIPEESILSTRLSAKVLYWNEELIFAPMSAKKVWRYNLKNKEWKGYDRKPLGDGRTGNEMFDAILYGDMAFIIGSNYPAIMCVDLLTDNVDYIEEPYNFLREKRKQLQDNKIDSYFRTSYVCMDNIIYLATCLDNKVLKLNLDTREYEWMSVGSDDNRYSGIAWDGTDFWLAPRMNNPLVKWDGKETVVEYNLPDKFREEKAYFLGVVCKDDKVILPAFYTGVSLVIDKNKMGVFEETNQAYYFYKKYNDLFVALTSSGKFIITDNDETKNISLECNKKDISNYVKDKIISENAFDNMCVNESNTFDISSFSEILNLYEERKEKNEQYSIGEKIWGKIQN